MNNRNRSQMRRNLLCTLALGSSLTLGGVARTFAADELPPVSIRTFEVTHSGTADETAPRVARKQSDSGFVPSTRTQKQEPAPFTPPTIVSPKSSEPAPSPGAGQWVPRGMRRRASTSDSASTGRGPWVAPQIDNHTATQEPSARVAELPAHLRNRGSNPSGASASDEVIEVQPTFEGSRQETTTTTTTTRSQTTINRNRVSLDSNEPLEDVVEPSEEEIREQTQVDGDIDEESLSRLRSAIRSFPERKAKRMEESDAVAPQDSQLVPEVTIDETETEAPESPAPQAARPATITLRPQVQAMQPSIAAVLVDYYNRPENAATRSPWGTFHLMLPFGGDANVVYGNRKYNSAAWLCSNRPCRGQRLMTTTRSGRIYVRQGPGLQGHQAQLLAMLAQINTETTYPLSVGRSQFTVEDLIRAEMADCRAGAELTFSLIGLSHYLPTDTYWTASDGTRWDFERVIAEELNQPIVGAACGGTHRLMGFSYALRQRRLEGLPIEGQWRRAEAFIKDFVEYAWTLQNADGTFSTKWFEGPEDNRDLDRKIQTTGHIIEWLIFTADQQELQDERFTRTIMYLVNAFSKYRTRDWAPGPKGHVLRALSLYHRRVYGDARPWATDNQAAQSLRRAYR